ncbi:histidine phosphatase family protein [Bacillus sp. KH172YL63]|uniref:histidine phosphatase family protein n=1 Tax=Bacillus sp. KH172YL63 TaxID=2709784 RepID=UPI0013E480FC|nr:histidine phosphatase family protein [Bacillus sp. KH172YL63]BCB03893.1 hypothetical protein KH172YL63_20260 [Bacillus sp. KH172YL63]
MDDYMVIMLIRHAVTAENELGQYIGWTNSSLSPTGIDYLHLYKHSFRPFKTVYASDLNRTMETAAILFQDASIISTPLLREIHFGEWEGLTHAKLKDDAAYQMWLSDPNQSPPNGEGIGQFKKRINIAWSHIMNEIRCDGRHEYAIISHGGVMRHLLTVLSPMNEKRTFWEWDVPHASGYELRWKTEEDWRKQSCTSLRAVPLMEKENG